jgi:hypothetical protein
MTKLDEDMDWIFSIQGLSGTGRFSGVFEHLHWRSRGFGKEAKIGPWIAERALGTVLEQVWMGIQIMTLK